MHIIWIAIALQKMFHPNIPSSKKDSQFHSPKLGQIFVLSQVSPNCLSSRFLVPPLFLLVFNQYLDLFFFTKSYLFLTKSHTFLLEPKKGLEMSDIVSTLLITDPVQPGLFYEHLCNSLIHSVTDPQISIIINNSICKSETR